MFFLVVLYYMFSKIDNQQSNLSLEILIYISDTYTFFFFLLLLLFRKKNIAPYLGSSLSNTELDFKHKLDVQALLVSHKYSSEEIYKICPTNN